MFDHYTTVSDENDKTPWLKWRDIVISRRKPRKMWIQANTVKRGDMLQITRNELFIKLISLDEIVTIVPYDDTHEGLIQSWVERFSKEEFQVVDEALVSE